MTSYPLGAGHHTTSAETPNDASHTPGPGGRTTSARSRRLPVRAAAVGTLCLAVALAGGLAAGPAAAETTTAAAEQNRVELSYVGRQSQWITVPDGVVEARITVIGAAGGDVDDTRGGEGAAVSGAILVRPGQVFEAAVGERGGDAQENRAPGDGGWGSAAFGGRGGQAQAEHYDGGGGGGTSSLHLNTQALVIAAGGGGAGGHGINRGGRGGTATVQGGDGHPGTGYEPGPGGFGGAALTSDGYGGGHAYGRMGGGGGGGGGLNGGTGGSPSNVGTSSGGGGGAGSSYTAPGALTGQHITHALSSDGHGRLAITWVRAQISLTAACPNPGALILDAAVPNDAYGLVRFYRDTASGPQRVGSARVSDGVARHLRMMPSSTETYTATLEDPYPEDGVSPTLRSVPLTVTC